MGLYRIFNPKYKSFTIFGQDFLAKHLLGWDTDSRSHDAVGDAIKSIQLFNYHQQMSASDPDELTRAKVRTLMILFKHMHPLHLAACAKQYTDVLRLGISLRWSSEFEF